jgi:hypothetical protein
MLLALLCLLALAQPATPPTPPHPAPQETSMTPETLAAQVRAGGSDAVATAAKMGPSAVPTLQTLAKDKDPDVRLVTMRCFDAVGTDAAIDAALAALTDQDSQVASRAAVVLHHHPPKGRGTDLIGAFGAAKDAAVRTEIPKVAGRVPTDADTKVWVTILPTVKDDQVRDGVLTGLAKMGHQPSREWFLGKLAAADGHQARPWLEAAEYMDDAWVLPTLAKLLDRRSAVYTVAPDIKPEDVRVCDLAAYVIFKITKAKVEFPVAKGRYNDVQLDAARAAAQSK